MVKVEEKLQDASTREEMAGTAPRSATSPSTPQKSKNACRWRVHLPCVVAVHDANLPPVTEMMSLKRKPSQPSDTTPPLKKPTSSVGHTTRPPIMSDAASNAVFGRNALLSYIQHPTSFPPSRVISHTDDFVAIHDLYPKSTVHLLLLSRDPAKYDLHPFEALADPAFLAEVRLQAGKLKKLAAGELRRRYGTFSAQDAARNNAMKADPPPAELPSGRDWENEIIVGIHAHPSMSHLHIHVISVDRVSECMRHRKHYNSFATPFFVPLTAFPLAEDDRRKHPGREGYLASDLKCWRCNKNFGNKFQQLKAHLEEELQSWKRL